MNVPPWFDFDFVAGVIVGYWAATVVAVWMLINGDAGDRNP